MKLVTVQQGQCLMDVAIQHAGSIEAIVSIALLNGISVTSDVAAGSSLLIDETNINAEVVNYLANKKVVPATANDKLLLQRPIGIGYWSIQQDFVVT